MHIIEVTFYVAVLCIACKIIEVTFYVIVLVLGLDLRVIDWGKHVADPVSDTWPTALAAALDRNLDGIIGINLQVEPKLKLVLRSLQLGIRPHDGLLQVGLVGEDGVADLPRGTAMAPQGSHDESSEPNWRRKMEYSCPPVEEISSYLDDSAARFLAPSDTSRLAGVVCLPKPLDIPRALTWRLVPTEDEGAKAAAEAKPVAKRREVERIVSVSV